MSAPTWLRYTALALSLHVEEARAAWRERGGGPHAAVDSVIAGVEEIVDSRRRRRDQLAEARALLDRDPLLGRLRELFGLDGRDGELVALLAALQLEPKLAAALGYAEDDIRPHPPTPSAAARLFGWDPGATLGPTSPLVTFAIAAPLDDRGWQTETPWALDPSIATYLAGGDLLAFWPGLRLTGDELPDGILHPAVVDQLEHAARSLAGGQANCELELVGRPGGGRRTVLAQLCRSLGYAALMIEAPELGTRALRAAMLLDAVPIWVDPVGAVPIDPRAGRLALAARERSLGAAERDLVRLSFTLDPLTAPARRGLWSQHSQSAPPSFVEDWSLTPGELVRSASASAAGADAVRAQLRRRLASTATTLMAPVRCPYTWEDLILAELAMRGLRELENQVRMSAEVLDEWGFRRLTPERRGTTALFAGPSGTGKTMAASVLARSLGLELYRVDLSQVVDKYIGETEKRLAQVLDECERSRVIVLFDEADALFGQRTRVRDAHDRYANIEIDYLLSRLDSFDGLAILATNRKSDLDPAFMRRIQLVVDFMPPSRPERARLWEVALPAAGRDGAPIAADVDRERLTASLELSAAEIKSVALGAAFLARAEGALVCDRHLWAAAERELAKRGRPLPTTPPAAAVIGHGSVNGNGHR